MPKLNFLESGDSANIDQYNSIVRMLMGGSGGHFTPTIEADCENPDINRIQALNNDGGTAGYSFLWAPKTFLTTFNQYWVVIFRDEVYANRRDCTEDVSTFIAEPNIVQGGSDYDVLVYKDGTLMTEGSDYTLDYVKGIITPTTSWAGSAVEWTGFYRVPTVVIFNKTSMAFSIFTTELAQNYPVLKLYNNEFEAWDTSVLATEWTCSAGVSQNDQAVEGEWCALLTATGAAFVDIRQQPTQSATVTDVIAVAVVRLGAVGDSVMLGLSMDNGGSFTESSYTVPDADHADALVTMIVAASGSTNAPVVRVRPQVLSTELGYCRVEAVYLLGGALP